MCVSEFSNNLNIIQCVVNFLTKSNVIQPVVIKLQKIDEQTNLISTDFIFSFPKGRYRIFRNV